MRRTACAHQHAAGKKLREILRKAAQRGDAADRCDSTRQYDLARIDVHQPCHRNADQHVEHDIGRPDEKPQLFIGQVEVDLDALRHYAEHARVKKIQHRRKNDDGKCVIGGPIRRPGLQPW